MHALSHFLKDDGFMPHGMCILWRPDLLLLHAISDSLIAAAYYSIPIALIYFVMKRKDVEFRWMFLLFGTFILACGTTHILAVWTLWHPDYVADGAVKAVTAVASLGTAAALWRVMPAALAIPGRQQLETMNRELRTQIRIRREAEESLQELNVGLGQRVQERTAQLERANATLKEEIAERGSAEGVARENERRFRNLVEGSIQAILVHRDGKPLFVNQAYACLVGCEGPDEVLALASIDRFIAPHELDRVMRSREALLRHEHPSVDYEIRMQRKDGSSFWAYGQGRMVIWNGDPAIQLMIIDITDRRKAEEELRQAQKIEAIGQLTSGVAHDLSNLLAVVIGNLELIEDNVEADRDLQETVRVAWRAAQQAVDLTERLLSFARRQPLDPTPTNVNDVILGMESMLSRTLGETIEVVTRRDDELWPVVIDRSYLKSAILNLALNSRDAMPDGGELTIATSNLSFKGPLSATVPHIPPGDYVTITVTDTGVGMTPEIAERAFEPFFTTKEIGKGTGLGLSMVYGFVRQSSGYVTLNSEVGRGASIRIYLPRDSEYEPPAVTVSAEADDHAKSGVGTILVVEDDPDVQSVVCGMVQDFGYRVLRAADGFSAVHLLDTMPAIDILLTDVVLPGGMLGPEIVRIALSRRPQIDYLYMSAHTNTPTLPDGAAFPIARLIRKPFRRVQLARKLRQLKTGELAQVKARRSSAGPEPTS